MSGIELVVLIVMAVLGTALIVIGGVLTIFTVLFYDWCNRVDWQWCLGFLGVGVGLVWLTWYLSPLQIIILR